MAKGELWKTVFHSYAHGDSQAFQYAADHIIRDEESKNNKSSGHRSPPEFGLGP
jgi:hypothetical protein